MLVYQLKLKDYDILLDPVFNSLKGANIYKNKYKERKIEIVKKSIDINNLDYIYRIKTIDEEGYSLLDTLFNNIKSAEEYILEKNLERVKIVKEYFSNEVTLNDFLIEV